MENFAELYLSHPSVQPPARATSLTPSSDTSAPPAPRPCALSVRNRQGFECSSQTKPANEPEGADQSRGTPMGCFSAKGNKLYHGGRWGNSPVEEVSLKKMQLQYFSCRKQTLASLCCSLLVAVVGPLFIQTPAFTDECYLTHPLCHLILKSPLGKKREHSAAPARCRRDDIDWQ